MQSTYPACFYPDEEQKGAYAVVVPDLSRMCQRRQYTGRSYPYGYRCRIRLGS